MSSIIQLNDIAMSWDGKQLLHDINLTISRGDFLAITGPNGGGKTTLLRIILRLLSPTYGSVSYFDVAGQPTTHLAIGYLPQKNALDSKFPITVSEMVEQGIPPYSHLNRKEKTEIVAEAIATVGLSTHSSATLGTLSGGQMQRALMARAIISKPELLVLDEPLSYVDKHFEHRIYDIVRDLAPSTTIILVSHEMTHIAQMATHHIIVDHSLEICSSPSHFLHYDCCDNHSHE